MKVLDSVEISALDISVSEHANARCNASVHGIAEWTAVVVCIAAVGKASGSTSD